MEQIGKRENGQRQSDNGLGVHGLHLLARPGIGDGQGKERDGKRDENQVGHVGSL
jgi:hypothetical protein